MNFRSARSAASGVKLFPKPFLRMLPFAFLATSVAGQSQQATPAHAFEVASVKVMDTKNPHPPSVNVTGDGVNVTGMTLKELIKISYDLNYGADHQLSGGPAWTDQVRFDIEAKEDPALGAKLQTLSSEDRGKQLREMLRGLLADRFKLQIHHEKSELAIYNLVTAKSGSKLMPSSGLTPSRNADNKEKPRSWIRFAGKGVLEGTDADLPTLATVLCMQPEIDGRLVVDKTGLTGKYDFTLKWTPDAGTDAPAADAGPSLFTALQEELGLRLESTRAPVDVIVIDQAEMPTAN
jgi:uncharacterized protein (TIGR03435 family)